MKKETCQKLQHPPITPYQDKNSSTNTPKSNENLLSLVKSITEVMGSSTNKDSDSISLKDAMQTDSSVDPIEKEEYSNVTHPFNNPNQNIASSTDKSEKGNNPEVLFAVDSKCSEIGTTRD